MPFDPSMDKKRLSLWLFLAALALLAALMLTAFCEHERALPDRVVELTSAEGGVDRCASCHAKTLRAPRGPHATHDLDEMGCAVCHGGTPLALEAEAAHSWKGRMTIDPRLTAPGIEASCSRCHPTGIEGSENAERGAEHYVALGCALCHGGAAANGPLVGPELRREGRRRNEDILETLRSPNPGSVMPSYRELLAQDEATTRELLLYTASLGLTKLEAWQARAARGAAVTIDTSCQVCHGEGTPSVAYEHTCPDLRQGTLTCAGCHDGAIPKSTKPCPRVEAERPRCGVCHASTP